MESFLTSLDSSLLFVYFAIVLFVGWRAGRAKRTEQFLLAERKLGPWESAASMCASKTGAGVFLTQVALVYLFGIAAAWTFLGVLAGYIGFYFFAAYVKPRADANQYYTLSDYFFEKFGPSAGYASAFMVLAIFSLGFATQLIGGAKILDALTGFGYIPSLALMTGVIVAYILMGGFKAVVATDVVQYVAIVLLTLILAVFLFSNIDTTIADHDLTFSPDISGALFIASFLFPFAAADLWQRVYATEGKRQAQRSLLYAMVIYTVFGFLLTAVGLFIKQLVITDNHDMALVFGFQQMLPAGLMGASVIVLYAALMSSADTNLFTSSSILVQDFYGRLGGDVSHARMVSGIRVMSMILGAIAFVLAAFFADLLKIGFVWFALNVNVGTMVLLSWIYRPSTALALTMGFATSAVAIALAATFYSTDPNLVWVALVSALSGAAIGQILSRLRRASASQQ